MRGTILCAIGALVLPVRAPAQSGDTESWRCVVEPSLWAANFGMIHTSGTVRGHEAVSQA